MKNRNHLFDTELTAELLVTNPHASSIPMAQLLDEEGNPTKQGEALNIDQALATKMLTTMQFTRVLDERMVAAQRQGRISFYLASTGEEAASVGSAAALEPQDLIMSQYREQGALAFRGYSTEQFMNQMFSNEKDPNKGRQMPVHYGQKDLNFMTISSPLGTQIPQAAGYAYGQKMAGQDAVTICFFGEGAASEGDFHAGLNMAAVLKCPTIFFCRNNGYAISTPAEEQFAGDGIAARGIGYGIKTLRIDGNDIFAVYAATQLARKIALEEQCPVLIEAMTYRLAAHSTSDDPTGYRSKEEEAKWASKDPIKRLQTWMVNQGFLDLDNNDAQVEVMRQEVLQELKRVEQVAVCPIDAIIDDVYDTPPWHLKEQLDALKEHIGKYPDAYPKTSGRLNRG